MMSLSPEFSLVAACTIWPPSDRRDEAIRSAAAQPLSWTHFLRVARRHRVVGLVHDGLDRTKPDMAPEIARELSSQTTARVLESLAMAAEAVRLQRLFDNAGVEVLFLKGSALAMLAFGNLGLRESKDIDLLVSNYDLPAAVDLITGVGYRRFDPPMDISDNQLQMLMSLRRDLGFFNEQTGLHLELHWRPFLNPYAADVSSIMAKSQVVLLTGTAGVQTLGEEDLFTYLCVHGALHWWTQLKWLADIGAIIAVAADDKVERLCQAAEAKGAGRAAAQAMRLCQRVLYAGLPPSLSTQYAHSTTVRWLEKTAINAMTAGRGEIDRHELRFGTTRGSLSALLLRRNWRYRLTELRTLLINESDILALRLPRQLNFLYPIIRFPLWIWRHVRKRQADQSQPTSSK